MTASLKRLICRVLIGMLLSTQFAVAAYACPELPGLPTAAQTQPDAGMEHGSIDPMLPNLCVEHCHPGEQKADHTPVPTVAPALLTVLYALPAPERVSRTQAGSQASAPSAPADPPHAILHCCLRD